MNQSFLYAIILTLGIAGFYNKTHSAGGGMNSHVHSHVPSLMELASHQVMKNIQSNPQYYGSSEELKQKLPMDLHEKITVKVVD